MSGAGRPPANPFLAGEELLRGIVRPAPTEKADLVFVVSAAAAMQPFWNQMQKNAEQLHRLIEAHLPGERIAVQNVRFRLIAYKDMYMFTRPFHLSPFYRLPENADSLRRFIRGVTPKSQGNQRSSGLEALLLGMYSDWLQDEDHSVRHVIVLVADAPPYSLEDPMRSFDRRCEQVLGQHIAHGDLPLPVSLQELRLCWLNGVGSMDNWNNFLFVYAPACPEWEQLSTWDEISMNLMPPRAIPSLTLDEILSDVRGVL